MSAFTVVDVEQRSPEWFAARLGRVTGSTADAVLAKGKSGAESVTREKLKIKLALERVTGRYLESEFQTDAMRLGVEREPLALAAYEAQTGQFIERTGFLRHNVLQIGCSLDAHVGDYDGLVSVKCPSQPTHWDTIQRGAAAISAAYMRQIWHELYVTGAQWSDFVSWNPEFPEKLQLMIVRIPRNVEDLANYESALMNFLAEVDQQEAEIRRRAQ